MTTRSVGDLCDDLRKRADARGMEVRHPDSDLYHLLTQSLRSVRSMVIRNGGGDLFRQSTTPAALPTTPPMVEEQYLEIAWPPGAVGILGIDVLNGQRWEPLEPVSFLERRKYQSTGGPPRVFAHGPAPGVTPSSTVTAGAIQLYPFSTLGLTHRVWYVPEFPLLDDPNLLVQGFDGDWLEWALWDSTIKICAEDDDVQAVDQIAARERAVVQERIEATLQRVQSAGVISPRRARAYR